MDVLISFLNTDFLGTVGWMWCLFLAVVITLLALDLGVLHRKQTEIGVTQSLWLSGGYIGIALLFGAWVWHSMGNEAGMNFMTGFFVEKTLALDNIFIISLIFSYLAIPRLYQHRVLFWGILGVIVLRGIMIGLGAAVVSEFSWVLYIFAAFLIFTGIKMLFMSDHEHDIEKNPVLRFARRHMRITNELHQQRFFIKQPDESGKIRTWATPLFLALLMVEIADLIFAVDSIPAVFAITTDPFIVYTSNIFAILGLRALYFALAAVLHRFAYLKQALAVLLVFIGSKVFVADLLGWTKFPAEWSLMITVAILGAGIVTSLWRTRRPGIEKPLTEEA